MSIKDKLQSISDTKIAIKQALEKKGKTPGDRFSDYAPLVNELVAVDGLDGSKVTGAIVSKAAETFTPTTENQTIAAGQYLAGDQTIQGDVNLAPENIKKGTSVFGVTGEYETPLEVTNGELVDGCASSGTIPANTFVKIDTSIQSCGIKTKTSTDLRGCSNSKIYQISSNKYVVTYIASGGSNGYIQVIQINDDYTMTYGTAVFVYTSHRSATPGYLEFVPLSETTGVVICGEGEIKVWHVSLKGVEITLGTPVAFDSSFSTNSQCSCGGHKLSNDKFMIYYQDTTSSSRTVYAVVGSITETTITKGNRIELLYKIGKTHGKLNWCFLDEQREYMLLGTHSTDSAGTQYVDFLMFKIDLIGLEITAGTIVDLTSSSSSFVRPYLLELVNEKVLVAHNKSFMYITPDKESLNLTLGSVASASGSICNDLRLTHRIKDNELLNLTISNADITFYTVDVTKECAISLRTAVAKTMVDYLSSMTNYSGRCFYLFPFNESERIFVVFSKLINRNLTTANYLYYSLLQVPETLDYNRFVTCSLGDTIGGITRVPLSESPAFKDAIYIL